MYNISNRRYTGSKYKLADWIIELIENNCKGDSFFEVFAGTSIITSKIAPRMKRIILNDNLEANNIIYKAFYEKGNYSIEALKNIQESFNNMKNDANNHYFSENYGNTYFSINDCRKIENIRNRIDDIKADITEKEYAILIASLIYSMDKCANTVGHFDAYIRNNEIVDKFYYELVQPLDLQGTEVEIYKEDSNILAGKVKADIAYVDPPYNSRQYCQFYHIYETIVRWDKPKLYGVALKPESDKLSDYCRIKAPLVFADLINNLQCRYIAVSYNNTYNSKSSSSRNKITLEEIELILSGKGEVKTFSRNHKFFNAGKTEFKDHKEHLFIVKAK